MEHIRHIGRFIRQMADELVKTVTPTVREWELWCMAVAIFVLALMILVTGMDFSLGKLTLWLFG